MYILSVIYRQGEGVHIGIHDHHWFRRHHGSEGVRVMHIQGFVPHLRLAYGI